MKPTEIYAISGTDYKEITKEILETSELASLIGDNNKKIGIKPNLVAPTEASFGGTTHPEVVAGILEYLQEHGFRNLCILEGSWVGDRTEEAFEVCGYQKLSEQYGVPLLDMQKEKSLIVSCMESESCGENQQNSHQNTDLSDAPYDIRICAAVKDLDFLINVPVLKGHCQTKMTCALKNLKGLIPNAEKRRFHALGLHRPIAYLNKVIHQDFIVVDNICGDLDFEDGGNPCVMNRILTGRDPVLTDAWLCHEMHYETEEIPYLSLTASLGVGEADWTKARIRYLNAEAQKTIPLSRKLVELQDYVEEVESCSACYGYLIPALERLKQEGYLKGERKENLQKLGKICIGQGYRGKTGELGVGNCTRNFRFSVEGCPPTDDQIYEFLKSFLTNRT